MPNIQHLPRQHSKMLNALTRSFNLEKLIHTGDYMGVSVRVENTSRGITIAFDKSVYASNKYHWLDMDVDDFCKCFNHDQPWVLEHWYEDNWTMVSMGIEACPEIDNPIQEISLTMTSVANAATYTIKQYTQLIGGKNVQLSQQSNRKISTGSKAKASNP